MKTEVFATELLFKHPFVLAAGTRTGTPVVFMRLHAEGKTAWAEAALPPYFGLTTSQVIENLKTVSFKSVFSGGYDINEVNEKVRNEYHLPEPVNALITSLAVNLTRKFTVSPGLYQSTLTVSPSPGVDVKELLRGQENFSAIKIKAGSTGEQEFIETVLSHITKPFCIDVNRGWKNREKAASFCEWLEKKGCLLIEQPFDSGDLESHLWLRNRTSIPVMADEAICTYSDLLEKHQAFDGVNIKLLKCGGYAEAGKMIEFARDNDLKIILGCMSESSLGCATSARLAHMVHYADLDGPYLIKNDPFTGYRIENGEIKTDTKGVVPSEAFLRIFSSGAVTLSD